MYTIVDEIRLNTQAKNLDALAAEYDSVITNARAEKQRLSGWDSPAGAEWLSKVEDLLSEATATAQNLRSYASSIRNFTASHHYLLEEEIGNTIENIVDRFT